MGSGRAVGAPTRPSGAARPASGTTPRRRRARSAAARVAALAGVVARVAHHVVRRGRGAPPSRCRAAPGCRCARRRRRPRSARATTRQPAAAPVADASTLDVRAAVAQAPRPRRRGGGASGRDGSRAGRSSSSSVSSCGSDSTMPARANDIAPSTRPSHVTRPSRISIAAARTVGLDAGARERGEARRVDADRARAPPTARCAARAPTTSSPRCASRHASSSPTAPPPTTTTSCRGSCASASLLRHPRPHQLEPRRERRGARASPAGSTAASSAARVAAPDRRQPVGADVGAGEQVARERQRAEREPRVGEPGALDVAVHGDAAGGQRAAR